MLTTFENYIKLGTKLDTAELLFFLSLPLSAFAPIGPAPVRKDELGIMAYQDSGEYYNMLLSLNYKVRLLLSTINYDIADYEPEGIRYYTSLGTALSATYMDLAQDDTINMYAPLFFEVAEQFGAYNMLFAAGQVIPSCPKSGVFADLFGALTYQITAADTLFYLVCHDSVDNYVYSNYMVQKQPKELVAPGCTILLDEYYNVLKRMRESGC